MHFMLKLDLKFCFLHNNVLAFVGDYCNWNKSTVETEDKVLNYKIFISILAPQ